MKPLFFLMLLFWVVRASGQSFIGEATVPIVQTDGFYRILLSPALNAHLNNELSDVRIYNQQNEVPYLLQKEMPTSYTEQFIEYEILKKQYKSNCCTSVLLKNVSRSPINNIQLIIKNAEASRKATLRGSDDGKTWFAIKDQFTLNAPDNFLETQALEVVDFPWSNYEFYLLEIADSVNAPLNILKAGYYSARSLGGKYAELPLSVRATDSASQKKTFVHLMLNSLQFVDKLEVVVSGTKYYRRNATLLEKRVRTSKSGKHDEYYRPIQNFELTSGRTAIVDLMGIRGQEFLVEIENDDNPPLTISSVKAFQLNRYLTAWLKKDEHYTIKFGQPTLAAPVYDLAFFKDSIPNQLGVLGATNINVVKGNEASVTNSFFTSKTIIWAAIAFVMLVLGGMSIKMAREASQKGSQ